MKDKQALNLFMHCSDVFAFFIVTFPYLCEGLLLFKFSRTTQAFSKIIKIKKIRKSSPFSMHVTTTVCRPCPAVTFLCYLSIRL